MGKRCRGKKGKKKNGGGIAMECAFIQQIFHFLFHLDTVQLRSQQKEVFRLFAANYSISDQRNLSLHIAISPSFGIDNPSSTVDDRCQKRHRNPSAGPPNDFELLIIKKKGFFFFIFIVEEERGKWLWSTSYRSAQLAIKNLSAELEDPKDSTHTEKKREGKIYIHTHHTHIYTVCVCVCINNIRSNRSLTR